VISVLGLGLKDKICVLGLGLEGCGLGLEALSLISRIMALRVESLLMPLVLIWLQEKSGLPDWFLVARSKGSV